MVQEQHIQQYLRWLDGMHPLVAAVLVAVGGVFLARGWKTFKVLVALDACAAGVMLGGYFGQRFATRPNMDIILGGVGGVVFAAVAWPLTKWAVSVLGATAGAIIGFIVWQYGARAAGAPEMAGHAWAGAAIGLVSLGLLALVVFRTIVIIAMSLQGSAMFVTGLGALVFRHQGMKTQLLSQLDANVYLLPLLLLLPTALGFIFQESQFLQGLAKKRKAALAKAPG